MASGTVNTVRWVETRSLTMPILTTHATNKAWRIPFLYVHKPVTSEATHWVRNVWQKGDPFKPDVDSAVQGHYLKSQEDSSERGRFTIPLSNQPVCFRHWLMCKSGLASPVNRSDNPKTQNPRRLALIKIFACFSLLTSIFGLDAFSPSQQCSPKPSVSREDWCCALFSPLASVWMLEIVGNAFWNK